MDITETRYSSIANMFHDGAKDKGNTAIDDDCKIENMQQQKDDEYTFSDCDGEYGYDSNYHCELHPVVLLFPLYYKRGELKPFKAKPFKSVSRFLKNHRSNSGIIMVDTSEKTLELLQEYCEGYAKIIDQNATCYDDDEMDYELEYFTCEFADKHWRSAIELVKAAIELDIQILVYWMMKGVDRLISDKAEDEVYDLFFVNLKKHDIFKLMEACQWRCWRDLLTDENDDWDPELLKLTFNQYKQLESYEQRRQWLTAHFLLRDSPLASGMRKEIGDPKRRFKAERDLVKDPIYIRIEETMKWKSKRKDILDKQKQQFLKSLERKFSTSFDVPPYNKQSIHIDLFTDYRLEKH